MLKRIVNTPLFIVGSEQEFIYPALLLRKFTINWTVLREI